MHSTHVREFVNRSEIRLVIVLIHAIISDCSPYGGCWSSPPKMRHLIFHCEMTHFGVCMIYRLTWPIYLTGILGWSHHLYFILFIILEFYSCKMAPWAFSGDNIGYSRYLNSGTDFGRQWRWRINHKPFPLWFNLQR